MHLIELIAQQLVGRLRGGVVRRNDPRQPLLIVDRADRSPRALASLASAVRMRTIDLYSWALRMPCANVGTGAILQWKPT